MALLILLAFLAIPLVEIAVYIEVGGAYGVGPTLIATLLTAVIGTILMRTQGLATLNAVRTSVDKGEMPLRSAFDGACQLIAGILLLTPGFVTDAVGLLLFIPPVRSLLLAWIIGRASVSVVVRYGPMPRRTYDVEGDYRDVTPDQGTGDGARTPKSIPPRPPDTER